jgi:hypothetical protein
VSRLLGLNDHHGQRRAGAVADQRDGLDQGGESLSSSAGGLVGTTAIESPTKPRKRVAKALTMGGLKFWLMTVWERKALTRPMPR